MALLHNSVNSKKFDTRMVERNVSRGVIAPQEVSEYVKSLPDDAENSDWVSLDELAADSSEESAIEARNAHDSRESYSRDSDSDSDDSDDDSDEDTGSRGFGRSSH